jgi:CxxC motif-containing protein
MEIARFLMGVAAVKPPTGLKHLASLKVFEPIGRVRSFLAEEPKAKGSAPTDLSESHIVCTFCPRGCVMSVETDGSISGYRCEHGRQFAELELVNPLRMFTGTIRITGSDGPLVPVRTSEEVPRSRLRDVARLCKKQRVMAPVTRGQVLIEHVGGLAVDLVATADKVAL